MRVAIVFNHPYKGSYCNAILNAVTKGLQNANHEIDLIHLDNDNFDPVMREKDLAAFAKAKYDGENIYANLDAQVLNYKQRLEQAEHLIFIFPIWWELMPATTRGFIDKVIFPSVAYDYKPNGFMKKRWKKIRGVTIITTMNTPGIIYRFVFGNAIKKALLAGTFWKIGYKNRKWIGFSKVKTRSDSKRKKWLSNLEKTFESLK